MLTDVVMYKRLRADLHGLTEGTILDERSAQYERGIAIDQSAKDHSCHVRHIFFCEAMSWG